MSSEERERYCRELDRWNEKYAASQQREARLRKALEGLLALGHIEYLGKSDSVCYWSECPTCGEPPREPHRPDCETFAALKEARAALLDGREVTQAETSKEEAVHFGKWLAEDQPA
jgi:hypothetical protein